MYSSMPVGFRYTKVYGRGKPEHTGSDPFRLKHPPMDLGRRAKIFAPFDALKGFREAVAAEEIGYSARPVLSEEALEALNYRLSALFELLSVNEPHSGPVPVTVSYFAPCGEEGTGGAGKIAGDSAGNTGNGELSESGAAGLCRTETGLLFRVDPEEKMLYTDFAVIPFTDLLSVESEAFS